MLADAAESGLVFQDLDLFHQLRLGQLGIEPHQGILGDGIQLMALLVFLDESLVVQKVKVMALLLQHLGHVVV